ncbi:helix-turn-helix domain-containing protein [Streptomyces sp. BE133]|uniref:helix-turn-helix domain-containing protein n=1 Tax=Streptomyces sp. BE133 TaxID=3002523 RepID=UPI002E7A98E7|nr:helix-turn-helix domain-containing protein [Streptomyces sp. BE133]MEE1808198.1 Scr1 family TA system antitoxin-like transcriptional regulator [Streptomyces sp. BE133]
MALTHPAVRAAGGYLRDARERRYVLPEQAAALLAVSEETLLAMEAGHTRITSDGISRLCHFYRCPEDAQALRTLAHTLAAPDDGDVAGAARDWTEGHHRRLAGCARQAREVRWLSTALIPPPLQTPEYARVVGCPSFALPDAPLPSPHAVYVLDERILLTDRIVPEVMAPQLRYLLGLDVGEVRVVPGRIAAPRGHLVELSMPAGPVFARPEHDGVLYLPADRRLSALISDTWDLTTPAASRELLVYAAQEQLGRGYVHAGAV